MFNPAVQRMMYIDYNEGLINDSLLMVVEMAAISMVTLLKSWKPTIGLRRPRLDGVTQGVEEIMSTRQLISKMELIYQLVITRNWHE